MSNLKLDYNSFNNNNSINNNNNITEMNLLSKISQLKKENNEIETKYTNLLKLYHKLDKKNSDQKDELKKIKNTLLKLKIN